MVRIFKISVYAILLLVLSLTAFANDSNISTQLKGVILEVLETHKDENGNFYQKLKIRLKDSSEIIIENNSSLTAKNIEYKKGEKIVLQEAYKTPEGESMYVITDYQRTGHLYFLFVLFTVFAILVGRKYGLYSLVGMAFSYLIIFKFILPQILAGGNPILITTIASLFIIPVTFYLSHGFNKKTHVAIASTIVVLVITVLLTAVLVSAARLTGYSSEEAMFLQVSNEKINMKGILLAGIIIGFLGVLDDVTVSQSSMVMQLKSSNRDLGTLELYKKAMAVGRDHITSMINTLILVYTGASLPLLLLFVNNPHSFSEIINMELIAEEVVRTLIGSIGLITAVPLSTLLAAIVAEEV
ncbi:YibE/F family protein [Patescibacteria group bacterium]|nr:YibE/F family protein [Patescibacteria group bacterium]